ncbi:MAG: hypothetical protein WKF37_21590 [Bryobacteraceae bacterium]
MIDRRKFLAGSAAFVGCRSVSRGFDGYAFIANQDGHSIAVVDLARFTVARQIRLESGPTEILSHPNKPLLYAMAPGAGMIFELDFARMAVARQIRVAPSLSGMRLDQDRNMIWALSRQSPKLLGVDLNSMKVAAAVPLPIDADRFDLSPAAKLAVASASSSGSLVFIDLEKREASGPKKISASTGSLQFRHDGKSLLVANTAEQRLTILQTPSGRVVTHLRYRFVPIIFVSTRMVDNFL